MYEVFEAGFVSPAQMDWLWAHGWRHFGVDFFRYDSPEENLDVTPLRIDLSSFKPSQSQKRILIRNRTLESNWLPAKINPELEELFERHKIRFDKNIPESLNNFVSSQPDHIPNRAEGLEIRLEGKLIAYSYLDLGATASSSVYQFFDPELANRSLGIFSILKCIERSSELGLEHYYLGYAYRQPSFYDYKKRFSALEVFDWDVWKPNLSGKASK